MCTYVLILHSLAGRRRLLDVYVRTHSSPLALGGGGVIHELNQKHIIIRYIGWLPKFTYSRIHIFIREYVTT
jgi:hypothetical protein